MHLSDEPNFSVNFFSYFTFYFSLFRGYLRLEIDFKNYTKI